MAMLDRCPRCGRGSAVESVGGEPPAQTTHAEGCWGWGPKHYSCAAREIERLRARVAELDHEHDLSTSEGIRSRIRELEAEVDVLTSELEVVEEAEAEEGSDG